ncbi:monosaccharide ABC transporter substrate-binding protein, CUT2 family [Agromyces sp. CF514]|uniref:sugar ABC transporter substrate-binding protein n=1 Tax=Agromyces sp. CF514 TaxID=1881031 RepID=UPI0008EAE63D|nr:substrate-binding domain-containing protein [Agromyces sp. CF514]SFR71768.1 monosaccharide ABC transporter substrate-binding protein, CUT2 family [Agromyces sp. CF514]
MKKASLISITALAGASMLLLAGCSSSGGDGGSTDSATATRACVILPDAASSPRWENGDRPALETAITDAGFEADIQNAQGDTSKYATIADQQLSKGCGVMLLVDYNGAAVAVAAKAKDQGIPVIAYDRPIEGADYYVSFDNEQVGALEGQSILDGLATAGKDPKTAVVVYMGGDPADGNAKMFHDGAVSVMEPAGIKPAQEPPGVWDGDKSATNFEQALTALGGKVDAVWVANDTNAAGVITILDKNGLTVPVSGQDASVAGLQNVLLGKQTATVYKPFALEADAASELAIQLLNGETPSVDKKLDDGTPYIAVTPILVGPDDVQTVVDDGNADAAEICTADVAAACTEHGVG